MMRNLSLSLLFLVSGFLQAGYKIERIDTPKGIDAQIGGLDFMPDGRLIVAFNYGKIFTYNPQSKQWKLFAEGLHLPLGVLAISNHEIMVMQRPELTRIIDRDKNGHADSYLKFYDDFGLSGNYHEFAFGPVRDTKGNFYIGLNVASNNGGILSEPRGTFLSYDIDKKDLEGDYNQKLVKKEVTRMYSCVPYRGWIMKIDPQGNATPYASGVRSPNGLGFDHKGRLFVSDNQGDWLGSSKLHHIREGAFHGHPASLIWKKGWKQNPKTMKIKELDDMRQPAAALFSHGILANSPTQPLLDSTQGKFGPFSNQMFIGDMNLKRLLRFIPEEVNDTVQGTLIPFLDGNELGNGNNRLVFDKNGALWVGKTHLSWAGDEGLKKISWDEKTDFDILKLKQIPNGFRIFFTKKVDLKSAKVIANYAIKKYSFDYNSKYGSPRKNEKKVTPNSIRVAQDGLSVDISLPALSPGHVYQFETPQLKSSSGEPLASSLFCYNLIELIQN
ncbi:PQQ-dependent sugar dehydrogenase [Lentisphaera profundi]|uniref:PQQ-dependent sugar dehydrogenase n=1 Tax=Lentisphaera profundi TaxID=1658616 RepID=A0ABY7W2W8_9BACT|nr:PQQ-dependent sugar dehydrogenase [Lentisphaera profundi]WDE99462.1 PQQ-dependent sugar dehydrogenase [Lentisphaera profundi]